MSAFGGKADMAIVARCLLLTQSGHFTITSLDHKIKILDHKFGRTRLEPREVIE